MAPRYDMLAIDLDGTLLDSRRRVSAASVEALAAARRAGLTVTICTGRGLAESRWALEQIGQRDPVVVAGGSMVACPVTSRTIRRFSLEVEVVARATDGLLACGHPVLVLKDPLAAGYDYLVVVGPDELPIDPVTAWWFEKTGVRVRTARSLEEDAHPEHTVRIGVCTTNDAMVPMMHALGACVGDRAAIHHFPAVVDAVHCNGLAEGQAVHILEVFGRGVNKWTAISWLAQSRGIDPSRIAAIGDEINDVAMIRGAGLGVAMANGVPEAKAAADRTTGTNDEDGVAAAIGQILAGAW